MSTSPSGIARRIQREISEFEKIRDHARRRWQKASKDEDYLGSVAFDLQGFYQGAESVFATIAKSIDRSVPSGDSWHRMLLDQMTSEAPGIRPAVISMETKGSVG